MNNKALGTIALIIGIIALVVGWMGFSRASADRIAVPAEIAHRALSAQVSLAQTILEGEESINGGRAVFELLRDETLPEYGALLTMKLTLKDKEELLPLVDIGIDAAIQEINTAIESRSAFALTQLVYSDTGLVPWAQAVLATQEDLTLVLDSQISGGVLLGPVDWILDALWNLFANGISSLPVIGDILEQILGTAHGAAH